MTATAEQVTLDAAATAPLRPAARAAMLAVWEDGQANASSVHAAGHRARATVDRARAEIAATFGVRDSEVIFTSGGTEANSLAIVGMALARPRGRHLVTTAIEHPSVLESCRFLERVHGFTLDLVPVDEHGRVALESVRAVVRPDTTLVSIGLANGEIGTVQAVPELAEFVSEQGVPFHSDAVQAAATLPVSCAAGAWPGDRVDALTIASHKFGGPQGAGALLVRDDIPLEAVLHGGGQERGVRSGTENVAALAGFAAAVRDLAPRVGTRAAALVRDRDEILSRLRSTIPGLRLTGHPTERLPGHASFVVPGVSGESVLVALDAAGLAASSGSACAAGKNEPSPVLLALGVSPEEADAAVRFTLADPLPSPLRASLIERIVATVATEAKRRR